MMDPDLIRAARAEHPKLRERDLAAQLGISEAELVAAHVGHGVRRIAADPDRLVPALAALGEVMALTRNDSAVHEKVGRYDNYQGGNHAAMVLADDIDLRIFPQHWVHGFAVARDTEDGPRHSLQVFDGAGDAVHKVYLRAESDAAAYQALVDALATEDPARTVATAPRPAPEGARGDAARLDALRGEWARMTDTHQFMRLTAKLKFNRLGAYRMVGAPFATQLDPTAVDRALAAVAAAGIGIMVFVGNRGCIQIHSGPIATLRPMGPWQNVMDPRFNLHLRLDHIAEVWRVAKPTRRGDAISVEAFDAEGRHILQIFGQRGEKTDMAELAVWNDIAAALPDRAEVPA
ncbi:hemin-degrading factor [Rhodobacter calidifons]|uniref:Hemin-degrading factor n=1 Tax=Rhodobacter calidifons TaxID=2715277 RepID=A0ABX0G8F6_9RHOB|nr:ChuX/HutX family heme-like substrate-binding protein [Rhodobacter calidifons]NHB77501.1 hemin-degrading factor [Rhodobacter calidifons]